MQQCTVPTPAERRALLFLAALAALGVTARGFATLNGSRDASAGEQAGLDRQIAAVDSAVAGTRARSRPPKKATGEGHGTSSRAVGRAPAPATVERQADHPLALYEARRRAVEASNRDARERTSAAPDAGAGAASAPGAGRGLTVDLDIAGADAIAGLPWIGDVLAARIVAERTARGAFGSLMGLQRVRGIGPGLAARIAPFVTFSRASLAQPDNPPARSRFGPGFRP